jgi:peptidoglycan hydrolase CwlO-like protein
VRPSPRISRLVAASRTRQAQAFLLSVAVALLAATGATADPGAVASKEAQAQQVVGEINQIDLSLSKAVEAYNLATVQLQKIKGDLRTNKHELKVARADLARSQTMLEERLVNAYTSTGDSSTLGVLLGSTSLDDLLNRVEEIKSTSRQDASIVSQVTHAGVNPAPPDPASERECRTAEGRR